MHFTRLKLKNWRNFQAVDVRLSGLTFLVGPNAAGKSNFLDAFRFLRDISMPDGGLQKAIFDRHGVSKLRCLAARTKPNIEIEVDISDPYGKIPIWQYAIGIKQETSGFRNSYIDYERVQKGSRVLVDRPNSADEQDPLRKK